MNLQDIRRHVVELSGRFDLVEPLYDQGSWPDQSTVPVRVDYFINAALRFLDNRVTVPELKGEFSYELSAGEYLVALPNLRSVETVWVNNVDGTTFLVAIPTDDAIHQYGVSPFSDVTAGSPIHFTVSHQRSLVGATSEVAHLGRYLFVLPPTDAAYTLFVRGYFSSNELVEGSDVNWWSYRYPDILINAALYKMEGTYRNTAGAEDYLRLVERDLQGVEFNAIEGDIANVSYMRKSW